MILGTHNLFRKKVKLFSHDIKIDFNGIAKHIIREPMTHENSEDYKSKRIMKMVKRTDPGVKLFMGANVEIK